MRNILSITILVIMFFVFICTMETMRQNTIVADTTGSQIMPKAVKCKDGSSYVSWLDTRGGSYYLYMQKK